MPFSQKSEVPLSCFYCLLVLLTIQYIQSYKRRRFTINTTILPTQDALTYIIVPLLIPGHFTKTPY